MISQKYVNILTQRKSFRIALDIENHLGLLYGFVHPSTGDTYWWILPFVNSQLFERVLEDFAIHWKVRPNKRVVLVVDGAGWH